MKRDFLTLITIALFVCSGLMFSCDEKQPDVNVNGGEEPPVEEPSLGGPEPLEHPDVPTPFKWSVDKAVPVVLSDGVEIEILSKEENNFTFACRPGQRVQSFRLDVYPLSILYNALMEKMNTENMPLTTPASEVTIEGWIREYLFAEGGSSGIIFNQEEHLNYNNMVFDWANSDYGRADIVPNCEYIIAVVGCADTEGSASEQLEMTLCYVRTPYSDAIGAPAVDVSVQTWTDRFEATFTPNQDCHYFYYLLSMESDLRPYIEHYGEQLYKDYMRTHVKGGGISRDALDYHKITMGGYPTGLDTTFMITALATDLYGIAAEDMTTTTFKLKEVPEGVEPAKANAIIDTEHVGHNIVWYSFDIAASTRAVYYRFYTAEDAAEIKAATPAEQDALVADLAYQGFGMANQNYKFSVETEDLSQSKPFVGTDKYIGLEPNTEYVLVYTAVNAYQTFMPLQFSEPFKTDALVGDKPAESKADVDLTMTAVSYTNVKFDFTYSYENTALYYFRWVNPDSDKEEDQGLSENASREEKLAFLLYRDDVMGAISADIWSAEPKGDDTYTMVLEMGTTYKVAYVGVDWNGVLGDVKFATVTTPTLTGGLNPEGKITLVTNATNKEFKFEIVKECSGFKYLTAYEENEAMLRYIGIDRYSDIIKTWSFFVTDCGIPTTGFTSINEPILENSLVEKRALALMLPIGTDASGGDIYGPVVHLVYDNGEARTLESYYPDMATPAVAAMQKAALQLRVASSQMTNGSDIERPKGAIEVYRPAVAADPRAVVVTIDRRADGVHPKAYRQR